MPVYYVNADILNGRARPTVAADPPRAVRHRGDRIVIVSTTRADDGYLWGLSTGRNWWRMQYLTRRRPVPRTPVPGVWPSTPWRKRPNNNTYWQTRGYHTGTDYRARTGTPIVALRNGRVVHHYDKVLGKIALLYYRDGLGRKRTLWLCHVSDITARDGASVKAGQVIAKVGQTGTGANTAVGAPHLHMELRAGWSTSWSGKDLDPLKAIQ